MPQSEQKILANRLKSIASELVGISKEIGAEALGFDSAAFMLIAADEARPVAAYNDARLAEYAERLYKERRRRSRYLPGHLFAEPAWDILLDLFVNGVRDRAISITSASSPGVSQRRLGCAGWASWKRKACWSAGPARRMPASPGSSCRTMGWT